MFGFLFLAPYARTTRYEEAFSPKGKKRPHYNNISRSSSRVHHGPHRLVQHLGNITHTHVNVPDTW